MAFTDQEFKISVDRAKLCNNDPRYTLSNESGGVVGLVTRDIQDITDLTRNNQKGEAIEQFKIDVEPDPLPNNDAHAVIFATPEFTKADKLAPLKGYARDLHGLLERDNGRYYHREIESRYASKLELLIIFKRGFAVNSV